MDLLVRLYKVVEYNFSYKYSTFHLQRLTEVVLTYINYFLLLFSEIGRSSVYFTYTSNDTHRVDNISRWNSKIIKNKSKNINIK